MTTLRTGRSGFDWGLLPLPATALAVDGCRAPRPVDDYQSARRTPGDDTYPYPGERPTGSFAVFGGEVLPIHWAQLEWWVTTDEGVLPLSTWLIRHDQVDLDERVACLGYGSNINPPQITEFARDRAVIVLRGLTIGLASTFCATRRSDLQFPAGIVSAEAHRVEEHGVVLIDSGQREALDGKEGSGHTYRRGTISGLEHSIAAVLPDGTVIAGDVPVYAQGDPRPVGLVDNEPALLADWTQRDFSHAHKTQTHEHGLRFEPLDEFPQFRPAGIPAFVYGTLMPGRSRWSAVRDFVTSHEPATIRGRRFETGYGFPGLVLDSRQSVQGELLHLDPSTYQDALGQMDMIEGHPSLYMRTLVRLVDGRLAWTYVWNDHG